VLVLAGVGGAISSACSTSAAGVDDRPNAAVAHHDGGPTCNGVPLIPRDPSYGPKTVTVVGDPNAPDAAPPFESNPAAWECYVDAECHAFPDRPYCDGFRCIPVLQDVTCQDGVMGDIENPEVKHTYSGTNGTFADSCDAQGNLLDYQCTREMRCVTPSPDRYCRLFQTGLVTATPTTVDCAGGCHDGRCDGRCPQQGDHITFVESGTDGSAVIRNDTDARTYTCSNNWDTPNDAFDCKNISAGQTGHVFGRSVDDDHCTGANFGTIAFELDGAPAGAESCAYSCSIRAVPSCADQ
jgi:hypothetical protein